MSTEATCDDRLDPDEPLGDDEEIAFTPGVDPEDDVDDDEDAS